VRKQARQRERQLTDASFSRTFDAVASRSILSDGSTVVTRTFTDRRTGKFPDMRQAESVGRLSLHHALRSRGQSEKSA
jgi:hypothetical protein